MSAISLLAVSPGDCFPAFHSRLSNAGPTWRNMRVCARVLFLGRERLRRVAICRADDAMTTPLILQIQEAALDSKSSVTDALRKAKIACAKLNLKEFGDWIELELNGYQDQVIGRLPHYRQLYGVPQGYNPVRGWQPIQFLSSEALKSWSFVPVAMTISAIEESLKDAKSDDTLGLPYPAEVAKTLRDNLNIGSTSVRIKLAVHQAADIVHAVRNILLNWTIDMEKQGILGENLIFSEEERKKSASLTAQTVNNINIAQVGAFAISANNSTVEGSVNSTTTIAHGVRELVQQMEPLVPVAGLPISVRSATESALAELKQAACEPAPDRSRLRQGLESLKRVRAPAGETILKLAVDTAIKSLFGAA